MLESHGLGHFSDLCEAEQITLLDEAHRELISEESNVREAEVVPKPTLAWLSGRRLIEDKRTQICPLGCVTW